MFNPNNGITEFTTEKQKRRIRKRLKIKKFKLKKLNKEKVTNDTQQTIRYMSILLALKPLHMKEIVELWNGHENMIVNDIKNLNKQKVTTDGTTQSKSTN